MTAVHPDVDMEALDCWTLIRIDGTEINLNVHPSFLRRTLIYRSGIIGVYRIARHQISLPSYHGTQRYTEGPLGLGV